MSTTMNRDYGFNRKDYERPIQRPSVMRYYFVYSFKCKHMRENVVDTWKRPE